MSYDFSMSVDAGGEAPVDIGYEANYTYNVSPMFYDVMGDDGISGLEGKTGAECAPILDEAIWLMKEDPDKYKGMNPENGWGSYEGALALLVELRSWCGEAPKAVMSVY